MPPLRVLNLLKYLAKCKEAAAEADLVGMLDCQGELSQYAKTIILKHPDPNACGVFLGLTLPYSKAHLTRAVLGEGAPRQRYNAPRILPTRRLNLGESAQI